MNSKQTFQYGAVSYRAEVKKEKRGYSVRLIVDQEAHSHRVDLERISPEGVFSTKIDGTPLQGVIQRRGEDLWIWTPERTVHLKIITAAASSSVGVISGGEVRAPMTGKIVSIPVKKGDKIEQGGVVAILEAMKMEYKLVAPVSGRIEKVNASVGDLVDLGEIIVEIK